MLPAVLAGEKLDARAAIAGRYISQEPVDNTSATASTSSRQSSTKQRPYWESGLFDKDSWIEAQSGWACSVVTGRARLGGMPCGKQPKFCPLHCTCVAKGLAQGMAKYLGASRGSGACAVRIAGSSVHMCDACTCTVLGPHAKCN